MNTPWSNFDPKFKRGPHADGIVGFASSKPPDLVANQMNKLSIN